MKKIQLLIFFLAIANFTSIGQFVYLNPLPNSAFQNPEVTLAIKNGDLIDESSLMNNDFVSINGSLSGEHSYTTRLSDDGKTIVVHPKPAFDCGEKISVIIHSNRLKKKSGGYISGTSYSFKIRDEISTEKMLQYKQAVDEVNYEGSDYNDVNQSELRTENLDSMATFTILTNNNPAPGQIFYRNVNNYLPLDTNCFLTIIENSGSVVWAQHLTGGGFDYKINHNGYITYFNDSSKYWMVLDSNYNIKDSITCGNGLGLYTNSHDVAMYPDGHALLLVNDVRTMDLTAYGGKADATVTGVKIQELDAAKDVIWEWSGWDYFNVTDAVSTVIITNYIVDYVHANSINRDTDGNILLSSRNLDEVTKIDRTTSDLIWRLNGENNQFTFIDDNIAEHFVHQHDANRLENGNLMLFNNGNFLTPHKSSSKEYEIDEVNKVATLAWYYEHPDVNGYTVYSNFMGNSQRLPNGNTLIDWGAPSIDPGRPTFTEVDSNKNIVWEMKFDEYGQKSYRAHKYQWIPCEMPKPLQISVTKITDSSAKVNWGAINNAVSYDVQYRKVGTSSWKLKNTNELSKKLKNLKAATTYEYQLRTNCLNGYSSDWTPLKNFTTLPAKFLSEEAGKSIVLFPNPVSDILNVAFDLEKDSEVQFSVFDITGKQILTTKRIFESGEQFYALDISTLPSSFYFAQVKFGSAIIALKFVKQ